MVSSSPVCPDAPKQHRRWLDGRHSWLMWPRKLEYHVVHNDDDDVMETPSQLDRGDAVMATPPQHNGVRRRLDFTQ